MSFKTYFNGRVEEVMDADAKREARRKEAIETMTKVIYDYLEDENFIESIRNNVMIILISAEKLGDENWRKVNNVFGMTRDWGESSTSMINEVTESLKKYPDLNGLNIINVARLQCSEELKNDCPKAIKGNYYFGLRISIK
jgi:hypothetical protein